MHFSEHPPHQPDTAKIIIAGGLGVGKTTLIGSISEIPPLRTEALMTAGSVAHDNLVGVEGKTTTTVAMDFGRVTLSNDLILFLFGTPGQDRFQYMWDEIARGAVGVVVLVDTRRFDMSWGAVDYWEERGIPFAVVVNQFDSAAPYPLDQVRHALALDDDVPVLHCDARNHDSCRQALITLVQHALSDRLTPA